MNAFDRFADWVEEWVAHPIFFTFCVLSVVIWAPSIFLFSSVDTWQLIINTFTTVVTFLLVALLQNTQQRFEVSVHQKLDAILEAVGRDDEVGAEKEVGTSGV